MQIEPAEKLTRLGQKAPSTRRCIKTLPRLANTVVMVPSESTQHQKHLFTGLAVRRLQTAPENGRPTASPLNRPSESPRTTPLPRAPSSSTATKASTPGGFMPGELARFQETSRSQNASTAGAGQADANQIRAAPRNSAAAIHSPLIPRPPTSSRASVDQATAPNRPARRPRFRRGAGAGR